MTATGQTTGETRSPADRRRVQAVVDAVLYEGYILYPYRPSSAKNRQRWTFGGLYPRAYFDVTGGTEPFRMQTQCLFEGNPDSRIDVQVRFLQPIERAVGAIDPPLSSWPADGEVDYTSVPVLQVDDRQLFAWQEAVERVVPVAHARLAGLLDGTHKDFAFRGVRVPTPVEDATGQVRGVLIREQVPIRGSVEVSAEAVAPGTWRLSVRIENQSAMAFSRSRTRDQASVYAFASTHTILGITGGAFVSQIDPPATLKEAAAACCNEGTYPVLIGPPGSRDTVLSSPIILYDYPEVAPESPGDLYDGLEIDEILSLRVLAMTDAEKREMAAADPRAAGLLARTEALDGNAFMRLHGVMRDPQPFAAAAGQGPAAPGLPGARVDRRAAGRGALKVGGHVRLRPRSGGDVMDVVLAGKTATIEAIERDFEDRVHVAVTLDDDPGREWGLQRMPGHRFFFAPDEVESLDGSAPGQVSS